MEFGNNRVTALYEKFYDDREHPYKLYVRLIKSYLNKEMTLLDAGCGREAPVLKELQGGAKRLIGFDLVSLNRVSVPFAIKLANANLEILPIGSGCVDMVISRSVIEHLEHPEIVFKEIHRVLKPGGYFIFLVPNLTDYVSLISKIVPNKLHPIIMNRVEGRDKLDTFPTFYRANSFSRISKLARNNGFEIVSFEYLSQYPHSLSFSPALFFLGILYDKWICRNYRLKFLRGWILAALRK